MSTARPALATPLLAAACLATAACPASAYTVRKEHPRIWIEGEEGIARLKKRIEEIPSVKKLSDRIISYGRTAPVDTGNLYLVATRVQTMGLAYLLAGRDKQMLAKLKRYADDCCTRKGAGFTDPRMIASLGFIYDWCHPDLTEAERKKYAAGMKAIRQRIVSRWQHSDYNNHQYLEWGMTVYAGLALHGDGIDDALAKDICDWGRSFIFDHGVKAVNQVSGPEDDGGWHESRSYHSFFFYEMCFQWEAWRTATGENPFEACHGIRGDAAWMLHTSRPHDDGAVGVADIYAYQEPKKMGWSQYYYMPLIAARYGEPVAQHIAQAIGPSRFDFRLFPHVLWYEPTVKAAKPEALPTARVFRGLGWAAMRSSWKKDATYCLFVSADYYAGHQHMDQNQVLIHKLGSLAIDACQYGAKDTKYHNTLLIGGSQRPFTTDPVRRYQPVEKKGRFDCGDILAFENREPHYTYVAGECANAYPKGKVKWFSRQVVFCRPDVFVIFDRTETPEPQPREWLLHSLKAADIRGETVTITESKGRLWSKTLLPKAVRILQTPITGGNKNLTHNHISVVPVNNSETKLNFLTVIHASSANSDDRPQVALVGSAGAKVTLGDTTWEVTFGTEGPPSGRIRITGGGAAYERELTREVQPNPKAAVGE